MLTTKPVLRTAPASEQFVYFFDFEKDSVKKYARFVEGRLFESFVLGEDMIEQGFSKFEGGRAVPDADYFETALYNREMKKMASLPKGWGTSGYFSEGFVRIISVTNYEDEALIDSNGKIIFERKGSIFAVHSGRLLFRGDYGYGYCDIKGKEVIPSSYRDATDFKNGFAFVRDSKKAADSDGMIFNIPACYKIDRNGKKIEEIKKGFDVLGLLHFGIGISTHAGVYGNYDLNGKKIEEPEYGLYDIKGKKLWGTHNKKTIDEMSLFYQLMFPYKLF